MSTTIPKLLKEIHRLRRHLRELQTEIDEGPRVLQIEQERLDSEKQAHQDAYDTLKKLKLKQKEDEVSLKATESRLQKLAADMNLAGSKKEFDAKQSEIDQANAKKGELEDAILNTIAEIEERTAKLPEVEAKWAEAQKEFATFQKDAKERLDRLLTDQKFTQGELAKVEPQLPPEARTPYDRLIKRYGPDGLAGVKNKSCQQCRTTLTDQQRANLTGGSFFCCPQCGRGLYLAEE
jgi:uncharacterized protein